ncbi:MAG: aldehyde ferredoxin oxidoreductase C-terminal domain-containing protein [Thermodesulfobacteriota bacterium]
MEFGGYAGEILFVDLSKGSFWKEKTDNLDLKRFIGGYSINCRLAYDLIHPAVDPLSPENAIIVGAGPMVGTSAPVSSKISLMTKYPMTGTITNGSVGGLFGLQMKWAGYDHIVVTGRAKNPVYIKILDDDIEICEATLLWGKDVFETTDMLWEKYGGDSGVMAIGKAGEKMVYTTIALVEKMSSIGKGGLGAVMGSKNLKALVVKGTKGVKVQDPERLQKLTLEFHHTVKADPNHQFLIDMGTMAGFDAWAKVQGFSTKNWTEKLPVEEAYRLYGPDIYEKRIRYRRISCPTCPVGCKDHVKLRIGPDSGLETFVSSFYGRVENWAARCRVGSYELNVKCQDFANRTGLCTHSITALIDWAVDLYKKGIITKEDTGGLELSWDFETTWVLINQIAEKEGLGKILGKGYLGAIEEIGRGCEEYAVHVKGIETLYDPRLNRLSSAEFAQVTNPRGGHPAIGVTTNYMTRDRPAHEFQKWCEKTGVSEEAIKRIFPNQNYFNVGKLTKYAEDWWGALSNSIGLGCGGHRVEKFLGAQLFSDLFTAVTGIETTPSELRVWGERAFNLCKVLNVRAGFSRKDDKFPPHWFEPIWVEGKEIKLEDYFRNPLNSQDCERLLDDYYEERGWDLKKGIPTKETLKRLKLDDVIPGIG